jgi:lipopolysaccharide transport system ATP-binding protein
MGQIAIRVENLGKRYQIGALKNYKALRDTLTDALYAPFRMVASVLRGRENEIGSESKDNFIWALKEASFKIDQGQAVGIVGRNGAGKSTLLKILSRITEPTEGQAEIHGRVGSLLEVGTGFHPELTGRENIFLNGAILGMTKNEIKTKFDDIVNFAEVEKFLDTPVKHYSSGMHVRLAFAVAAHLEPEILLVDEVLAVGDAAFQKKCLGKMGDVTKEGRTVLFVSHNMGAVRSLCDRAILIGQGRVLLDGDPSEVISTYLSSGVSKESRGEIVWMNDEEAPGGQELQLRAIRLKGEDGTISSVFDVEKTIHVEIVYDVGASVLGLRIRLALLTSTGEVAFQSSDLNVREQEIESGQYRSVCTIPRNLLNVGEYTVRIGAGSTRTRGVLPDREYLSFQTIGVGSYGSRYPEKWPGVVCPRLDWVIEKIQSNEIT